MLWSAENERLLMALMSTLRLGVVNKSLLVDQLQDVFILVVSSFGAQHISVAVNSNYFILVFYLYCSMVQNLGK